MLLDRENLISTLPEPCKTVYLHAQSGDGLPSAASGYAFNRLEAAMPEGFPASGEGLHALALGWVL
jgi:hypothetical protein